MDKRSQNCSCFGGVAPFQRITPGENGGSPWKPFKIIHSVHRMGKDIFWRAQCRLQVFYIFSCSHRLVLRLTQTLDVAWNYPCLQSQIFTALLEDAIFRLQPCFYVFTKRQATVHPPSLFSLSVSHCLSCLCTGRQLVQKQAPCPPPQTQRWRNWALSTLSSYNSTLNVSTDRRAGGQAGRQAAFSALNSPPLHFHFPPTHTLIYTRSWFLISRGGCSLLQSVFCK